MSKRTILFVDDDPIALRMIIDQFKKHFGLSFRYEKASSAQEAEEVILTELSIRGQLPALIVSDWLMPGKRGDEFLQDLARFYPEIPLILHSGHADEQLEHELIEKAGLLCKLSKPWNGQEHIRTIHQAIQLA
jgi:CheY-like chemotaxis protein